jgi:hypothetical protein
VSDLTLAPAVYWRLRFLQSDAENAQLKAQSRLQAALTQAGVPADVPYTWRDADTTLVAPSVNAGT